MIGEILRKYQVVFADFGQSKLNSSIQQGKRYAIIVSNDKANRYSTVVNAIPLTSVDKKFLPTHLNIPPKWGLTKDSILLGEQITSISKLQIIRKCEIIDDYTLREEIDKRMKIALDL